MELTSSINKTWKICVITSLFGCLFLLFFLNQNASFLSLQKTIIVEFEPIYEAQPPMLSPIVEPSSSSSSSNFSSNSSTIVINHVLNHNNIEEDLIELENSTYSSNNNYMNDTQKECNMFEGKWVYKPMEDPMYDKNKCPFIEEKMSCRQNGRLDFEYEKWRWEAKDCDIPLFNAKDMLERLRNKRVIIVGDSLNRNMWESLSCLLYSSISPAKAEVHAEGSEYKVLKVKDYNTIVEFYWSPFLIEFNEKHKSGKKVLVLDKVSPNSKQWLGADVMVFNSGHWWAHHKGKFKAWDLFEYEGQVQETMPIEQAYERAMKTWANWVEHNVDSNKTKAFFRSISAEHNGKPWCYNSTQPIMDESYKNHFPKSLVNVIETLTKGMDKSKIKYLNITKLTEYRVDAHPSVFRSSWKWKVYTTKYKRLLPSYADCSHWCLPGLPDTWNQLLYASLFFDASENMFSL